MRRVCGHLAVGCMVVVAACGGPDDLTPQDAAVDAAPAYSITGASPTVVANLLLGHVVTVTGAPGDTVTITLDRASAGTVSPAMLTLDGAGNGSTVYTPCSAYNADCVGPATLRLALTNDPANPRATDPFTLAAGTDVGEVVPCQANANVMYLHGNDFILTGTVQSDPSAVWDVLPTPDRVAFDVTALNQLYHGNFSLLQLPHELTPGIYEQAERESYATPGHPGVEVTLPGRGCNKISGRFQIHDYTADPQNGAVQSVTISFEQLCDQSPDLPVTTMLQGCFHYQAPPANPMTPPPPDPTKVAVRVLDTTHGGTADTAAVAIFTDTSGTVVLDTQVDAYGMAQAALPTGGSVTTIQYKDAYEIIHTYRGVGTGDYIVVNRPAPSSGTKDMMLVTYTPPASTTGVALVHACPGGTSESPSSATLEFADGCRTPTFGLFALASFTTGPQQFVWQPSVTHVPNGNATVPATWSPMGSATVTLTNVPASSPGVGIMWSMLIDGSPYQTGSAGIATPTAGTQSVMVTYPPGAGHGTQVEVQTGSPYDVSHESRMVVTTATPSTISVDFAAQPVPVPSAIQQTATGASWTQTSGGAADQRFVVWQAIAHNKRVRWYLVEPNDGQASATLSLPATHTAEDPTTDTAAEFHGTLVFYYDYDTVSGFTIDPPTGSYREHWAETETYNMRFSF